MVIDNNSKFCLTRLFYGMVIVNDISMNSRLFYFFFRKEMGYGPRWVKVKGTFNVHQWCKISNSELNL